MITKIRDKIKDFHFNINYILPSIILSVVISSFYNPLLNINVKSFNRTMGNGLMNGVDIVKRISNIQFYVFVLVPITFFSVYLVLSRILNNKESYNKEFVEFMQKISAITLISLVLGYMNKFYNGNFGKIEVIFPTILIILSIIALIINTRKRILSFDIFKWSLCSSFPIVLLVLLICNRINIDTSIKLFILLYIVIFTILASVIVLIYNKLNINALKKSYTIIIFAPIITSLFQELINILNQYSVIINKRFEVTLTIYILSIITSTGYYLLLKSQKSSEKEFCFERYYYPLLIFTFALISTQLQLQYVYQTEFFEQSNHGTAISEFFNYGKIPIVETFDAHMLQNEIGGIIYGILNKDYFGALFIGYSLSPIFYIIYYFLFKKFFGRDIAFMLIILFPISSDNIFKLFPLLPLVILSFLYAYRNKTYKGCIFYWANIVISCLYKLDMGFSLAFASIIIWIILLFMDKEKILAKKLFLSCIYVVIVCLSIFIGICFVKGISPIDRIFEFLNLCQSNINWGYESIGDPQTLAFTICYFIIPAINSICIISIIYRIWIENNRAFNDQYIIVLMLGLITILNFSRGIVRHSLVENTVSHVISLTPLFISMLIYMYSKKEKILKFVVTYTIFTVFLGAIMTPNSMFLKTLISEGIDRYLDFSSYNTTISEKVDRAITSDDMKQVYMPLKEVLDKTLSQNETYIDFTNQTFLYSLTQREKPVYINQSPGLLSGEYTQKKFIEQCELVPDKTPFVLMPIEEMNLSRNLDGIENSYRYYLVSEYISSNFRPLFKTNRFAIWCRNDRYDEKHDLVMDLINSSDKASEAVFSSENLNVLQNENATLSINNNELVMKSEDTDPILKGIENLINLEEIVSKNNLLKISIEYESDKDGLFELFYTTDSNENFTQDKVKSKNMSKQGVFSAIIPCTRESKIRFDIPEDSTVKIKKIEYKGVDQNYNEENEIETIDYDYVPLDYHMYNLIDIPYIWANYDKIGIQEKEEQLILDCDTSIYNNLSSIDKRDGNYLYIDASSESDGMMTIQMGRKVETDFSPLVQFTCSLKQGENKKYLIRISSDFMWYSNEINSIQITTDNNSTINKTYILKGDTLK
ncbi:hypothetical protein [Clostridium neonatale]|uniref:hypothetical protein n=1 Tax=Clostridium neonatale TaxID=137838 RepID=UPI00291C42FE|nr:hypothetical protein [Clostridium neonatale]CAI3193836.1 conserved membrane hypothetical protein [Clostridium neonatale]CAI3210866.1 conserved membrane hypothetical protein [Clostridium neonatale]